MATGKSSVERNDRAVLASAIVLVFAVIDFDVPYTYPDGKNNLIHKICSPLKALSLNCSEALSMLATRNLRLLEPRGLFDERRQAFLYLCFCSDC